MLVKHNSFQGKDISSKKIYWDTDKNQFRHRIDCIDCHEPVTCMCYYTVEQALAGSIYVMLCNYCYVIDQLLIENTTVAIKAMPPELHIKEMIDEFYDFGNSDIENIAEQIRHILKSNISEAEIEKIAQYINDEWDYITVGSECIL